MKGLVAYISQISDWPIIAASFGLPDVSERGKGAVNWIESLMLHRLGTDVTQAAQSIDTNLSHLKTMERFPPMASTAEMIQA
jgi:hypothetical protein